MSQAGNNIVIRLEVQIPVTGQGAGRPVVLASPMAAAPVAAGLNGTTQISTPTTGPTRVRVDTCGQYICARGTSIDGGNIPARTVFAKVYHGDVPLGTIPDLPDTVVRAAIPDRGNGTWQFFGANDSEIPGAQCADCGTGTGTGGSGLTNTLALWVDWGNYPLEKCRVVFQGCCDTVTECDVPPGAAAALGRTPATLAARVASAAAPAPLHWSLDAEGFPASGPSAVLNGSHVLSLRASEGGHGVWDNTESGAGSPYVELRGGAGEEDWELTLRAGDTVVRYRRPAGDWDPLGPNTLELAEGKPGRRKLPHSLTIVPL
jgi:hypothetical protein